SNRYAGRPPGRALPILLLQVGQDLARRVRAGRSRDASAGVRPRAAQVQALDAEPVARMTEQRPPREPAVEPGLGVERVAAREPVLALEVDRRQHLPAGDELAQARRVPLHRLHDEVGEGLALGLPVAL